MEFVKSVVDDQEDGTNFQEEVVDQPGEDFYPHDESLDQVEKNEDEYDGDPNNKAYTNENDTLDLDIPIAPNSEEGNDSSEAKEPATEQTDGPLDAPKDDEQHWDDEQKTASDTVMEAKQQAEETQKTASDECKDTKQQAEETDQKMASDENKETKQQAEETQKMASDRYKDADKVKGTANKLFVTSNNNNNNAAAAGRRPQGLGQQQSQGKPQGPGQQQSQGKPQGPGQQQSQGKPQQKPQGPEQQQSQGKPQQKPQGLGQQESQEEQQAMESGPTPQLWQKAQQLQPPPQQKESASLTQTQQQPQVNHETVAPQKTLPLPKPQPETQTQARSIPMELEKMSSPSGGVVPPKPTPETDAANLYGAFKGIGCDVGRVVQILSEHDPKHRHQIAEHYRKSYGEELSDRICSELSTPGKGFLKEKVGLDFSLKATGSLGWLCEDIKRAISLWLLEESERDATIVWQSLQLTSFDKAAVTEVISSRTPSQLRSLKQAYFTKYGSRLLEDISASNFRFIGYHKELLIACLDDKRARDEGTNVDPKMAEEDAKQLYKDGENMWGTNEKTFIEIFTKRNRPHLAAVDVAYEKLYGHSLEEAVKKETSRSFEAGLVTLLRCAKNSAKYFAEVLYNSMKGLGTSDAILLRTIVTKAGSTEMEDIKKEYSVAYKMSLMDAIHEDTSGHYRTFLVNLVE